MIKGKKNTITAHCIVKNEEIYIKSAILSVLPYVDKLIVFDTGSTDSTISIIEKLLKTKEGKKKIIFQEKDDDNVRKHTDLRNEMINLTETEWFLILDGDEIWPKDQIEFLIKEDLPVASKLKRNCIMVGFHLPNVDLYHYSESGHYETLWGLHGHICYRVFKKTNEIHWSGQYGKDDLYYKNGQKVRIQKNILLSSTYFWHVSKLKRSSKDFDVIGRRKLSKLTYLPKFLKLKLVKKYLNKLPVKIYEK